LIVQVYVDDIIFGATQENLCNEFSKTMGSEFEMSMMGELNFFLGLQIKQTSNRTMIHQQKYIREQPKRFGMDSSKPINVNSILIGYSVLMITNLNDEYT